MKRERDSEEEGRSHRIEKRKKRKEVVIIRRGANMMGRNDDDDDTGDRGMIADAAGMEAIRAKGLSIC